MCEQTEIRYVENDVVWVKLGPCWWPGVVRDINNLPEDIQESFRKKPIAAVKFFQEEDKYEYVRNLDQICLYNCRRKHDFIKKGMDMYRAKLKEGSNFMDKFPADVMIAEDLTQGDKTTIAKMLITEEEKFNYKNIFGADNKPDKKGKDKKPDIRRTNSLTPRKPQNDIRKSLPFITPVRRITHPRFLSPNSEYEARIREQTSPSSKDGVEVKQYNCQFCDFTSTRVNVIVIHSKTHTSPSPVAMTPKVKAHGKASASRSKTPVFKKNFDSSMLTPSTASNKQVTNYSREKSGEGQSASETALSNEKASALETEKNKGVRSSSRRSAKSTINIKYAAEKTPRKLVLGKRKAGKTSTKNSKKKKSGKGIEDLLNDWLDDDNEDRSLETSEKEETATKDTESVTENDTAIPAVKEIKTGSCFDFDDSADSILNDELEERAKKFVETRKISFVPQDNRYETVPKGPLSEDTSASTLDENCLKHDLPSVSPAESNEKESSVKMDTDDDIKHFDAEFQALMAETVVPHLPEIPATVSTSPDSISSSEQMLSNITNNSLKDSLGSHDKVKPSFDFVTQFDFEEQNKESPEIGLKKSETPVEFFSKDEAIKTEVVNSDLGNSLSSRQETAGTNKYFEAALNTETEKSTWDEYSSEKKSVIDTESTECSELSVRLCDSGIVRGEEHIHFPAEVSNCDTEIPASVIDTANIPATSSVSTVEPVSDVKMSVNEHNRTEVEPDCAVDKGKMFITAEKELSVNTFSFDGEDYNLSHDVKKDLNILSVSAETSVSEANAFMSSAHIVRDDGKMQDSENNIYQTFSCIQTHDNSTNDKNLLLHTESSVSYKNSGSEQSFETLQAEGLIQEDDKLQNNLTYSESDARKENCEVICDKTKQSVIHPVEIINFDVMVGSTNKNSGKEENDSFDSKNESSVLYKALESGHQRNVHVTGHANTTSSEVLKHNNDDDYTELDINSMPVVMADAVFRDESGGFTTLLPDYSTVAVTPMMPPLSEAVNDTTSKIVKTVPVVSQSVSGSLVVSTAQPSSTPSLKTTPSALKRVKSRESTINKINNIQKTIVTPKGEKMLVLPAGQQLKYCSPSTQKVELQPAAILPQPERVSPNSTSKIVIVSSPQASGSQQKVIAAPLTPHQVVVSGGQRIINSAGHILTPVSTRNIVSKSAAKYVSQQQPVRLLAPAKQKLTMHSTPTKIILPNMLQHNISSSSGSGVKILRKLDPQPKTFVIQGTAASTVITKTTTSGIQIQSKLPLFQNTVDPSKLKAGIQKLVVTSSMSRVTTAVSATTAAVQNTGAKYTIKTKGQNMTLQKITTPKTSNPGVITNVSQLAKRVTGVFPMSQAAQGLSKPQAIVVSQPGKISVPSRTLTKKFITISKPTSVPNIRTIQASPENTLQTVKRITVPKQKAVTTSSQQLRLSTPAKSGDVSKLQTPSVIRPVLPNVSTVKISNVSGSVISSNSTSPQSIVVNQLAQVVSGTPEQQLTDDGSATYVIVALEDGVGLQQYNSPTIVAYDPNTHGSSPASQTLYIDSSALSSSGDLSNMILAINDPNTSTSGTVLSLGQTSHQTGKNSSTAFSGSGQDILAAALANTDVLQPEVSLQDTLTVISNQHAIEGSRIAESSSANQTRLLQSFAEPIMIPLEGTSCVTSRSLQVKPSSSTSLDLPLTITQPVLSIPCSSSQELLDSSSSETPLTFAVDHSSVHQLSYQPSMPLITDDTSDSHSGSSMSYSLPLGNDPYTTEVVDSRDHTSHTEIETLSQSALPTYQQATEQASDMIIGNSYIPSTNIPSSEPSDYIYSNESSNANTTNYETAISKSGEEQGHCETFNTTDHEKFNVNMKDSSQSQGIDIESHKTTNGDTDLNALPEEEIQTLSKHSEKEMQGPNPDESFPSERNAAQMDTETVTALQENSDHQQIVYEGNQHVYMYSSENTRQPSSGSNSNAAVGVSMPMLIDDLEDNIEAAIENR